MREGDSEPVQVRSDVRIRRYVRSAFMRASRTYSTSTITETTARRGSGIGNGSRAYV